MVEHLITIDKEVFHVIKRLIDNLEEDDNIKELITNHKEYSYRAVKDVNDKYIISRMKIFE